MTSIFQRLKAACEKEPRIVRDMAEVKPNEGYLESSLVALGLTRADLRKLERKGFALRQYSKNIWNEGETLPDGKTVPEKMWVKGRGHRVLWCILRERKVFNA